jgi:hypothetical protein
MSILIVIRRQRHKSIIRMQVQKLRFWMDHRLFRVIVLAISLQLRVKYASLV